MLALTLPATRVEPRGSVPTFAHELNGFTRPVGVPVERDNTPDASASLQRASCNVEGLMEERPDSGRREVQTRES